VESGDRRIVWVDHVNPDRDTATARISVMELAHLSPVRGTANENDVRVTVRVGVIEVQTAGLEHRAPR
jgi:hypothetical protein